jgi:hypothetical protein
MAQEQLSLQPVLESLDALRKHIRSRDVSMDQEYRRTRLLTTIDGVENILKAMCMTAEGHGPYHEWEIVARGK